MTKEHDYAGRLRGWIGHPACPSQSVQGDLRAGANAIDQLRGNLSLAEEGLASAMQEIADLRQFKEWAEQQCQDYAANRMEIATLGETNDTLVADNEGFVRENERLKARLTECEMSLRTSKSEVCPGCNRKGDLHAPWCTQRTNEHHG